MNWLDPKSEKKIIFNKKSLTVNGLISTQEIVPMVNSHTIEPTTHPEYTLKEEKQIVEYFTNLTEIKNYCQEVYEKCKFRFEVFAKHPQFSKFWSRLNQVYNPEWHYNMILLKKDKKMIKKMRIILKNIVENPSEEFYFPSAEVQTAAEWGNCLKYLKNQVLAIPKSHKQQLRQAYFELKKSK